MEEKPDNKRGWLLKTNSYKSLSKLAWQCGISKSSAKVTIKALKLKKTL